MFLRISNCTKKFDHILLQLVININVILNCAISVGNFSAAVTSGRLFINNKLSNFPISNIKLMLVQFLY